MKIIDLHRCDRGTQIAEFALVLPLLLFISLGIIEGSSFIRVHQIINNAAREGARISALPENSGHTADIVQAVVDYAGRNGVTLPAGNVTIDQSKIVTTSTGANMSASQVTVTYGYPIQWLSKLPWFNVPPTVNLKATAEFANFYSL